MTPDYSISVNRTAEATDRRSAMKHTPGPWRAWDDDGTGTLPCVLAKQVTVAGNFYVAQCSVFADALLIAAAPNMLSALRAIAARVNGVWDDPDLIAFGPLSGCDDDCLSIANEALEKADPR